MKYDPFQKKSIQYIDQGHSVIVSAPTGAGKTVIAEHVIKNCLDNHQKVVYTAPIKALSNQKYRDFQKEYPDDVGILTGDVSINTHASTLIMTTEIFRNKILENHSDLENYKWIIFDEIHYLDDIDRGSAWEESLIFLPDHMRILGLSATIPNLNELARWLKHIHNHDVKVVKESKRPVPLHLFYQCQGKLYDNFGKMKEQGYDILTSQHYHSGKYRLSKSIDIKPNRLMPLVDHIVKNKNLPCVYFVFSRRKTEILAEEVMHINFLTPEEQNKITSLYKDLCKKFDIDNEPSALNMTPLINRGIAYHHAGMLPTLKEIIERLFTTRLIKLIFTTETFALGINMPAKTVIFDDLKKYSDHSFRVLKTRDFYQMAGRAGRRSIDKEGFVYCRVNPHQVAPEEIYQMINGEPERVSSKFNASYATILNLYEKFGKRFYEMYEKSFHHFQVRKHARVRALDMLKAKIRLLETLHHIKKGKVTDKGIFAGKVHGYELILSEIYAQGQMNKLSPVELGVLMVAIVYEPRKGMRRAKLNRTSRKLKHMTDDMIDDIHWIEKKFRIKPKSRRPAYHLSQSLEAWLNGASFNQILEYTQADEGEVVRYFRMTIQVIRETLDTPLSEKIKTNLRKVLKKINRDVVDAEKQLRA